MLLWMPNMANFGSCHHTTQSSTPGRFSHLMKVKCCILSSFHCINNTFVSITCAKQLLALYFYPPGQCGQNHLLAVTIVRNMRISCSIQFVQKMYISSQSESYHVLMSQNRCRCGHGVIVVFLSRRIIEIRLRMTRSDACLS